MRWRAEGARTMGGQGSNEISDFGLATGFDRRAYSASCSAADLASRNTNADAEFLRHGGRSVAILSVTVTGRKWVVTAESQSS